MVDACSECGSLVDPAVMLKHVRKLADRQFNIRKCRGDLPCEDCAKLPDAVILNLFNAWEDQFMEIIAQIKWDHLNGCYAFNRWGMYVGVERDGYIHS